MNAQAVTPTNIPVIPEDLKQLLENDPRVATFADSGTGIPAEHLLPAIDPATAEDRFFRLAFVSEDPIGELEWTNRPKDSRSTLRSGLGLGFGRMTEVPNIVHSRFKGKRLPDVIPFENWLAVSKEFLGVLRRFGGDALEIKEVVWKTRAGDPVDYCFVDITRLIDAYDFRRSDVVVWAMNGKKTFFGIRNPRTLKSDIDSGLHLFRDGLVRDDILVSKELGSALLDAELRGFRLADLPTGRYADMNYSGEQE